MAILICMADQEFARRFQQACSESKAPDTQEKLGKFLGVSGAMAWYYRNGEKLPAMKTAKRISCKLDVCVEWLLTGRGPKKPEGPEQEVGAQSMDEQVLIDKYRGLDPGKRTQVQAAVDDISKPAARKKMTSGR